MSQYKPKQYRQNEIIYAPDYHNTPLDPRAFLEGTSSLWQNYKEGDRQPIMYGAITIPKRLWDFAWQNTQPIYYQQERVLKFSLTYWEADPERFFKNPPLYYGKAKMFMDDLNEDMQRKLEKAYKITRRKGKGYAS